MNLKELCSHFQKKISGSLFILLLILYIFSFCIFGIISIFNALILLLPLPLTFELYFVSSLILASFSSYIGIRRYFSSSNIQTSLSTIIQFSIGFYFSLLSLLAIDFVIETIIFPIPEMYNDLILVPFSIMALFLGLLFTDFSVERMIYLQIVRFYRWSVFSFSGLIISFLLVMRVGSIFVDLTLFAAITGFLMSVIIGILSNTTLKLKESELRARMSEEKYYKLINLSPDAAVVSNASKIITLVNKECLKLFNYNTEEEMVGQPIDILFTEDGALRIDDLEEKTLSRGITRINKVQSLKKTGELFPTEISNSYFLNNLGEVDSFVKIIRDISEREAIRELQERFIAMTSHELRTPLTVICGYVDFLISHPELSTEERTDIHTRIEKSTRRLRRLTETVHDLSLMRTDKFEIVREKVRFSLLIDEITSQIQFYKNPIFINFSPRKMQMESIFIDLDRILQVIDNLISNSVKNSPNGSPIEIDISYQEQNLTFFILDYGCGIALNSMISIFQPFSHYPSEFSATGTGLGLYIVKQIVLSHQGLIEVYSYENHGTMICITLPANST